MKTSTKTTAQRKVTVTQDAERPVPPEVLAQAIVELSAAAKRLAASRLNRKAVIVLLAHDTGLPMKTISLVLDSIGHLEATYLKS